MDRNGHVPLSSINTRCLPSVQDLVNIVSSRLTPPQDNNLGARRYNALKYLTVHRRNHTCVVYRSR